MIRCDYGKSMYGGWYANFYTNGWCGIGAKTKTELTNQLNVLFGVGNWEYGERFDN